MYQDLSKRHDWSVKKTIVDLPVRLKGKSKRISGNSLSPWAPRTRISAPFRRRNYPGLEFVCDAEHVRGDCSKTAKRHLLSCQTQECLQYIRPEDNSE